MFHMMPNYKYSPTSLLSNTTQISCNISLHYFSNFLLSHKPKKFVVKWNIHQWELFSMAKSSLYATFSQWMNPILELSFLVIPFPHLFPHVLMIIMIFFTTILQIVYPLFTKITYHTIIVIILVIQLAIASLHKLQVVVKSPTFHYHIMHVFP